MALEAGLILFVIFAILLIVGMPICDQYRLHFLDLYIVVSDSF